MLPKGFSESIKICGLKEYLGTKGHFFVESNRVVSLKGLPGVKMEYKKMDNGVEVTVNIEKETKIVEPLFFCFGVLKKEGEQFIIPKIEIGAGADIHLLAFCSFPNARKVKHQMDGFFRIGKNARLRYDEYHYHGGHSGAEVFPKLKIEIDKGGQYENNFNLTKGTVGRVKIELEAVLMEEAKADLDVKVMGRGSSDDIGVFEKVFLIGKNSRSLIKMRAAAKDGGKVFMQGETQAQAAGCQGHVDCQEIVIGKGSVAKAVPIVEVNNDKARITHEASVGRVNQKELETLMSRGLNEDEATDLIVKAMLR